MTVVTIDKIENLWAKDSQIDLTDLALDSSKTLELHSKYYRIINHIKKHLRELESTRKKMLLIKNDYYNGTISKEELERNGWKPNRRTIIKSEIGLWMDADEDMIAINKEIGEALDILEFCQSIIDSINRRSFHVKNIIEAKKFENGEY